MLFKTSIGMNIHVQIYVSNEKAFEDLQDINDMLLLLRFLVNIYVPVNNNILVHLPTHSLFSATCFSLTYSCCCYDDAVWKVI